MLKNISSTLLVMVLAMLSSFAVTILLGRTLSTSDFGDFTLFKQILLIGSTFVVFGLDYSYIKNFSQQKSITVHPHIISLCIFSLISIVFVSALWLLYAIEVEELIYIYFCILFGAVNFYIAAIKRIEDKFLLAQLFAHGWKIVLLIILSVFMVSGTELDINAIYALFTISLFVGSSYFINYLFSPRTEVGEAYNVRSYLTFGLMFWLINSTGLISGGIDKLVIPILFGSEILGIYAAVSFLFVISLTMLGSAIGYVIFPKISAGELINVKRWSLVVFSICILAIVFYQWVGSDIVNVIFSGKYDAYVTHKLVFIFSTIGSLQIIHTILHFVISAKSNKIQLVIYWIISLVFISIFVVLLYFGKVDAESALLRISSIVLITRVLKILVMSIFLKILLDHNSRMDSPAQVSPSLGQ